MIGCIIEARRGDFHQSSWYLTITPHGSRNLSISGRKERPNWPEGSLNPIFPLNSCNCPKAFFFSLFTQQFLRRASSRKTNLLSGKDSFRFLISTDRTFFFPICFASKIFSILKEKQLHEILVMQMTYICECFGFFFWSPLPWYLFPPLTDLRELHWYMADW